MKGRAIETAFAIHAAELETTTRDAISALGEAIS